MISLRYSLRWEATTYWALALPIRTIAPAWRVVRTPDRLPQILAGLLDGAEISWHPAAPGPGGCGARIYLADPVGGILTADRPAGTFTRDERIGARVLTALARRPQRSRGPGRRVVLPDGARVNLRQARPQDLPAVTALCATTDVSDDPGRGLTHRNLNWLLSPRAGRSVLAEADARQPIGWAGLLWHGADAEAILVIPEAWQDRGLSLVLLHHLCDLAREGNIDLLWIHASEGDTVLPAALAAMGLPTVIEDAGAAMTVSVRLGPAQAAQTRGRVV